MTITNPGLLLSLIASVSLAACSSEPSATMDQWSLTRDKDGKAYQFAAHARLQNGQAGWFGPRLWLTDERGCLAAYSLPNIYPVGAPEPSDVRGNFSGRIETPWKVAQAELNLVHGLPTGGETVMYSDTKIIDPTLKHPDASTSLCDTPRRPTKAELREKAKTDPVGADSEAIDNMSQNEVVATAINSAGFLCARVTDMYPSGGMIMVTCVEYRNGSGRVKYRVDPNAGRVEQLD